MVLKSGEVEMVGVEDATTTVTDTLGNQVVLVIEKGVHLAVPVSAHDELIDLGVAKDVNEE